MLVRLVIPYLPQSRTSYDRMRMSRLSIDFDVVAPAGGYPRPSHLVVVSVPRVRSIVLFNLSTLYVVVWYFSFCSLSGQVPPFRQYPCNIISVMKRGDNCFFLVVGCLLVALSPVGVKLQSRPYCDLSLNRKKRFMLVGVYLWHGVKQYLWSQ